MKSARILIETAKVYYDDMLHFAMMGSVTALSFLLILPAPVTSAGMWAVAQRAVRGVGITWEHYGDGIKTYWKRNFSLSLILLVGYALALLNLWFYAASGASPFSDTVNRVMVPFWIVLTLLWSGVAFYAQPFLVELETPTLRLILRNSLFLAVLNPVTTLALLVATALLITISCIAPPLFLLTPGMILLLRLTAMRTCVQNAIEKQAAMKKPEENPSSESDS
ncbi:MAG: hypothetical protein JXA21_12030 [Anaerolineae bacterium]|nr:hypothetical protein [Anaerolineae bacterium]